MQDFDVVISGGGMVGALLACALGELDLRVAVVEARERAERTAPGFDDRAIAVAYGTKRIFSGLGLWDALEPQATPIHAIHVSDRGHFGMARMDRAEENLPALGYIIPARHIGEVLEDRLQRLDAVSRCCPCRLTAVDAAEEVVRIDVESEGAATTYTAQLLVAADGAESMLREQFGIGALSTDYEQTAIVSNISTQLAHGNVAYERFTGEGPLAVLPLDEQRCALVWTVATTAAEEILSLDDAAFLEKLQAVFGYRLGRIERVGRRQAWPLQLTKAEHSTARRLALVGNASHTLHPVAGQGFNLGARDVAVLAEVIADALQAGADPGADAVLARYDDWRRGDHERVSVFTDSLVRLFTLPVPALGVARGLGMLALDLLPPAKRLLTRMTMGRAGRTPRLSRGLPLQDRAGAGQ